MLMHDLIFPFKNQVLITLLYVADLAQPKPFLLMKSKEPFRKI